MLSRILYLTWHGIGTAKSGVGEEARPYWLPADTFAEALDVAAEIEAETAMPIRFTFDDGNQSDHALALPLLVDHKRTATFFVCAGRIGQPDFLCASQLKELVAAGMRIGSHGFDHLRWRNATDATLFHELHDGRRAIEDAIGCSADVASTPFGELDRRAVDAAKSAGYTSLFASSGGIATADTGLVPRNTVKFGFRPARDLPPMASWSRWAAASLYDTARRVKYGFY